MNLHLEVIQQAGMMIELIIEITELAIGVGVGFFAAVIITQLPEKTNLFLPKSDLR
jgi:flagellar biosynthesis protein FliQ